MFVNIYRQYRSRRRTLRAWNGSEQFTRGVCRNFLRRFHSIAIVALSSSLISLFLNWKSQQKKSKFYSKILLRAVYGVHFIAPSLETFEY